MVAALILQEIRAWRRDNPEGGFQLAPDEQQALVDHVDQLRLLLREAARIHGPFTRDLQTRIEKELYPCSNSKSTPHSPRRNAGA